MLIDSHCHFHLLKNPQTADAALAEAKANGVTHFLNVAIALEEHEQLCTFSARHPEVFASIGLHPCGEGPEPTVVQLVEKAQAPEIVAIGETGLDYAAGEGDYQWQEVRFIRHIQAAQQAGLPIIVHSRLAPADTVRVLKAADAGTVGGVIHCFVEDTKTAYELLDLGFFLSLSGILTFRNAGELRRTAAKLPIEQLLVETDCPYLAPVPYRGQENRPQWVCQVVECIADLKKTNPSWIAEQTAENFFRCFPRAAQRLVSRS